jgi:arogenate dehydrogenase (NADP+)
VGARWLTCAAGEHDRAVALISHLPVLVSAALLQAADRGSRQPVGSGAAEDLPALVRALASSGFADTTRVGGGNPELGTLMARSNRESVLAALAFYREAVTALEALVERGEWAALRQSLEDCQRLRPDFL